MYKFETNFSSKNEIFDRKIAGRIPKSLEN